MKCITKLTYLSRQYSDKVRNTRKVINIDNINRNLLQFEYEDTLPRVMAIERELKDGIKKGFTKILKNNISDSHSIGQAPITFVRQVLACVVYPTVMANFPKDVQDRASSILKECGGNSIGSYSADIGMDLVRKSVARHIEARDGFAANYEDIILSGGVTTAIYSCLQLLINDVEGKTGVMIPVPSNNLYPAVLSILGLKIVDYYLNENRNWLTTMKELERSFIEGCKYSKVKAIVVVNPGDPTGHVWSKESIESIIKFAYKNSLVIFADEVYQQNVYKGVFHSFKNVLKMLGTPYDGVELLSLMSTSKGYIGEAGIRGGWVELYNMDAQVRGHLNKSISAKLCPTTLGQTVVECMVNPPVKGGTSYDLYMEERSRVLQLYSDGVNMVEDLFEKMDGISCSSIQGAMYAYPRFKLPRKAIKAAKKPSLKPDEFYVHRLLEETGVCVVPGSRFGQSRIEDEDVCHFRITILPNKELMTEMVALIEKFYDNFVKQYS